MNFPLNEIMNQDPLVGAGLSVVLTVMIWVIVKTTVWWLLFGTGRLLFGKYSIHEWAVRSLMGMLAMGGMLLSGVYLVYLCDQESTFYLIVWGIATIISMRVFLREVFSLCGLLRGDWNPFHPHLKFIAWNETYLLGLFSSKAQRGRDDNDWMTKARELEAASYYSSIGYYV